MVEKLRKEFGDRMRYVAREFPIPGLHPFAEGAAGRGRGGRTAGEVLGDVHAPHGSSGKLDPARLEAYARELGLDLERFREDMMSDEVTAKIKRDKIGGLRSGANGTPTLFINGFLYDGPVCPAMEEELREALEMMLRAEVA